MNQKFKLFGRIVISVFLFSATAVLSQMPTLDPDKTVNPATGEMCFALPLGTVKGLNGHDFPIMLNYSAGILKDQDASCVGLGFSYGPGGITRQDIYMPDENVSGNYSEITSNQSSEGPEWLIILQAVVTFVTFGVAMIISVLSGSTGAPPAWVVALSIVNSMAGYTPDIVSNVYYSSLNFSGGGWHVPKYDYKDGGGYGFFQGGSAYDLPDNYFVNTPYISGQLVWIGDPVNGHFTFKQTQGSPQKGSETVDVQYTLNQGTNEKMFQIKLQDGTLLIFDKTVHDMGYSNSDLYQESNGTACTARFETFQKSMPRQWLLTKVIFPGYVDGSNPPDLDPTNSLTSNKGNWICFNWDVHKTTSVVQIPNAYQSSENSITTNYWGIVHYVDGIFGGQKETDTNQLGPNKDLEEPYLIDIKTPLQKAVFNFSDGRKDGLWFNMGDIELYEYQPWAYFSGGADDEWRKYFPGFYELPRYHNLSPASPNVVANPINRKVLSSINLLNNETGDIIKTIDFNTSYTLRPQTFSSFTIDNTIPNGYNKQLTPIAGNLNAASLTLNSVSIVDAKMGTQLSTQFTYDASKNPNGFNQQVAQFKRGDNSTLRTFRPYYIEDKDIWGYYCPNNNNYLSNDFNLTGDQVRASAADAWSLQKISLPDGKTIKWDYEPNRYIYANGQTVNNDGTVKYGGGIRVKKMTIGSGIGSPISYSYFYTSQNNTFIETPTKGL